MGLRVGIDVGGTFTDLVLVDEDDGSIRTEKVLTTPRDPSAAILAGLDRLVGQGGGLERVPRIVHGTTLVTNAVIERRGVPTGLITTRGFRDILEFGRENRFDIYDCNLEFPEPLVPRYWRRELDERLSPEGEVLVPIQLAAVEALLGDLRREGVRSVAVSLLHAFVNPSHERLVRDLLEQLAPDLFVSISSDVVPAIREYERTATTIVNAYVQPLVHQYLDRLVQELAARRFPGQLYLMHSNGGILQVETAKRFPVRLIESGPAAGALAAAWLATAAGERRALSFDMGGTTAKACYIDDGAPVVTTEFEAARVYRFKKGSGIPIQVPVIEMIEIGAGGGSIARVDELGLLKVGPDSAGAEPGPACYGSGGRRPTVTDADLLLGYLNPTYFLGGTMPLDVPATEDAVRREVAGPLGATLERAAWGIHEVVNHNMAGSARIHGLEQGRDPRGYTLVAFGGAGPIHACGVARELGIRKVLIPFGAGVASSFGLLLAPISFDFVRTYVAPLSELDPARISHLYKAMELAGLELLAVAGIPAERVTVARSADLRFTGQGYEITIPVPLGDLDVAATQAIARTFRAEYERIYGRLLASAEIEGVNWRVVTAGPPPEVPAPFGGHEAGAPGAEPTERRAFFPMLGGFAPCPVSRRYALVPGDALEGPAIVEEAESTTVVPPGARLTVDEQRNLVITLSA